MTGPTGTGDRREFPASSAQRRLFFLWSLAPGSAVYNVAFGMDVRGGLRVEKLDAALGALQRRHESLRTTFDERDGVVVQWVHSTATCERVRADVADEALGVTRDERWRWARSELYRLAALPFSLSSGPLWRVHVIEVARDEHLVGLVFHHVIMDEDSATVFARELGMAYEDPTVFLDAPAPQCAGHSVESETRTRYADGLAYWKEQLQGVQLAVLPEDGTADEDDASVGDRVELPLGTDAVRALERLCARRGVSAFAGYLGVYLVLLHRWADMTDVSVGVPMAARPNHKSYGAIGFFSNTIALRCQITPELTFDEILSRTVDILHDALEFQEIPFDTVVNAVRADRDPGRNPLRSEAHV